MDVKMVCAALAVSLVGLPVLAQDFSPRFMLPRGPGGELADAERERIDEQGFRAADADGDGMLTAAEIEAAIERAREARRRDRIVRMIDARDTDGDGSLSLAELQQPDRGGMFDRLDQNGDGAISREELEAMRGMHGRGRHYPRR